MTKAYSYVCHSRDRDKWLEARKTGIGASDVINDRLIATKTGEIDGFAGNKYTYFGDILERPIIKAVKQWAGLPARQSGAMLRSNETPCMLATIDGWLSFPKTDRCREKFQRYLELDLGYSAADAFDAMAHNGLAILEIKAPGLNQAYKWAKFRQKKGANGFVATMIDGVSTKPPADYYTQVQHQLYVTGLERACLVALLGGQNLLMHIIERDEDAIKRRKQACSEAWEKIVSRRAA